jgi:hypothetical protein
VTATAEDAPNDEKVSQLLTDLLLRGMTPHDRQG